MVEDPCGVDLRCDTSSGGVSAQHLMSLHQVMAAINKHPDGAIRQRLVLLRITMVHMYPVATKQRLFRTLVEWFADVGVRAEDILISLIENGYEDWYAGRL